MFEKQAPSSCFDIVTSIFNSFKPKKADEQEIHWMYDQVVDTRKQIESLKHLLLKESGGEELISKCQCSELSERLSSAESMVATVTDKLSVAEKALVDRDETILQLRAQLLRMKVTNDSSPVNNEKTISDLQVKLSAKEVTLKRLVEKNEDFPESKNCSEELLAARQCLDALRLSLTVDNPAQHILDHLEQILNVTVQRTKRENRKRRANALTSDGSTCSSQGESNISPFGNRRNLNSIKSGSDSTKILYYMDNSTTPYLSQIHKKLGQITLSDFKEVFDRSGHYRYHFKSVDTEFGPVKEELTGDDTIIPGWDGRIVGWVEELSSSLDHVEI